MPYLPSSTAKWCLRLLSSRRIEPVLSSSSVSWINTIDLLKHDPNHIDVVCGRTHGSLWTPSTSDGQHGTTPRRACRSCPSSTSGKHRWDCTGLAFPTGWTTQPWPRDHCLPDVLASRWCMQCLEDFLRIEDVPWSGHWGWVTRRCRPTSAFLRAHGEDETRMYQVHL